MKKKVKLAVSVSVVVIGFIIVQFFIAIFILPERESPDEVLKEPPEPTPKITAEDSMMEAELIKRLSKVAELTYFADHSASAAYDIAMELEHDNYGVRVPSNYVETYKWYTISILLGYERVIGEMVKWNREDLAAVMTIEQIKQAEHLAQEWMSARKKETTLVQRNK